MAHRLNKRGTGETITMAQGQQLIENGQEDQAAFAYVEADGKGWHKLGRGVDRPLTADEMLKESGTNYDVLLGPIFDPDMKEIDKQIGQRTYRSDNGATLGVVGQRYTVINNKDGFDILEKMLGKDRGTFVTGGALGAGETVFATARLPEDIKIAGDIITPYFHVLLKHDGTGSVKVYAAPTRQVCENTVNMALDEAMKTNRIYGFRHTATWNSDERRKQAEQALGVMRNYASQLESSAITLLNKTWDEVMFEKLVDSLLPLPDLKDGKATKAFTIRDGEREKIFAAYYKDDLNNVRDTAWGAINAIVDYSDHNRPQRGDEATRAANKFLNSFTLQGSTLKDKALELILATN